MINCQLALFAQADVVVLEVAEDGQQRILYLLLHLSEFGAVLLELHDHIAALLLHDCKFVGVGV